MGKTWNVQFHTEGTEGQRLQECFSIGHPVPVELNLTLAQSQMWVPCFLCSLPEGIISVKKPSKQVRIMDKIILKIVGSQASETELSDFDSSSQILMFWRFINFLWLLSIFFFYQGMGIILI